MARKSKTDVTATESAPVANVSADRVIRAIRRASRASVATLIAAHESDIRAELSDPAFIASHADDKSAAATFDAMDADTRAALVRLVNLGALATDRLTYS